ncbi:LicD family protein [Sporosarcina sp. ACRSM]|uniref:LicD family protein n=1 Tax=Sporosarcina sp. ACRSM TaxID=2918216 RepID=UPI001EF624DB|nr:LicD family protein [Sporosarcina sp. ACRSM]MCG7334341.1 LicD family protein [Sporosarcina sp. ACRSM]
MRYKMRACIKNIEPTVEEIRKMQKIMLEMLVEFDRICRKYDIPYSLDGGTFLGAVRHKGFIPWDPDADIVIMREDYNRFFEACKMELDHDRFFLQDYKTDEHYRWGYARLLRKGTSYVRAGHEHMKSKNGVFIDVFTMDSVPDNYVLRRIHRFLCFCIRRTLWSEVGKKVHPNYLKRIWYLLISKLPKNKVFKYRNMLANQCNLNQQSDLIRHMCSPHPKGNVYGFPRKLFAELVEYEFEGHNFFAFAEFDWYLKSIYGDYMTPPPENERTSHIPCSSFKLTEPIFTEGKH